MTEIELIKKTLNDAYKFIKEQEQTKETGELLINLFKAEILVKNCSIPAVVGRSEQLPCDECVDGQKWSPYYAKYVECDCRK